MLFPPVAPGPGFGVAGFDPDPSDIDHKSSKLAAGLLAGAGVPALPAPDCAVSGAMLPMPMPV
jgi:hypothetical protein